MEARILGGILRVPGLAVVPSPLLEACRPCVCGIYVNQNKQVKTCLLIDKPTDFARLTSLREEVGLLCNKLPRTYWWKPYPVNVCGLVSPGRLAWVLRLGSYLQRLKSVEVHSHLVGLGRIRV